MMKNKGYVIKNIMIALLTLFILGSFTSEVILAKTTSVSKKKSILTVTKELEQKIEQESWNEAIEVGNTLEGIYRKQLWKLQFLGDEREYEQLEEDIAQLKAVLQEKDKIQSKVQLAKIRTAVRQIYSP